MAPINAGIAGLVACIMLGKRRGYPGRGLHAHNVPFSVSGAILTGVFIRPDVLAEGVTVAAQTFAEFESVVVTVVWSAVASGIALTIAKVTVGLRVSEEVELAGLDRTTHGEEVYNSEG